MTRRKTRARRGLGSRTIRGSCAKHSRLFGYFLSKKMTSVERLLREFNDAERVSDENRRLRLDKEIADRKGSLAEIRDTAAALNAELSRPKPAVTAEHA